MSFRLSEEADANIASIINYIAQRDELAAERLYEDFLKALRLLGERPLIGHSRVDLTSRQLRFWTVRRYWMIAHFGADPVEIVAVLDARRDLIDLLR